MSRSPYFYVERFDPHTQKYELQHPVVWNWDHTDQVVADLLPYNGCHELFSIVEKSFSSCPEMHGIHSGLPHNCCEAIQKAYQNCSYENDWSEEHELIQPDAYWFTYADMYIYTLEHPTVKDWDQYESLLDSDENVSENDCPTMPNPIFTLKNRVDAFLEVMDEWGWKDDFSQIRIVYWIDS